MAPTMSTQRLPLNPIGRNRPLTIASDQTHPVRATTFDDLSFDENGYFDDVCETCQRFPCRCGLLAGSSPDRAALPRTTHPMPWNNSGARSSDTSGSPPGASSPWSNRATCSSNTSGSPHDVWSNKATCASVPYGSPAPRAPSAVTLRVIQRWLDNENGVRPLPSRNEVGQSSRPLENRAAPTTNNGTTPVATQRRSSLDPNAPAFQMPPALPAVQYDPRRPEDWDEQRLYAHLNSDAYMQQSMMGGTQWDDERANNQQAIEIARMYGRPT